MEVSGQLYDLSALPPENNPGVHSIEGCVGPFAALTALAPAKILTAVHQACSLLATPTELPRLISDTCISVPLPAQEVEREIVWSPWFNSMSVIVWLVVDKMKAEQFFWEYFRLPLSALSHQCHILAIPVSALSHQCHILALPVSSLSHQ